jgi:hypothetical protein
VPDAAPRRSEKFRPLPVQLFNLSRNCRRVLLDFLHATGNAHQLRPGRRNGLASRAGKSFSAEYRVDLKVTFILID